MRGQLSKKEEEKLKGLLRDCIREASAYAILSHRWEHEELQFSDLQRLDDEEVKGKQGFLKFDKFCAAAKERYKCLYVWADTVCIDKNSSTELDESIRSMYTWYRNAEVCLVHLSIADASRAESLLHDAWFQRGWTLQELLAPKQLKFFCQDWSEVYPQCGAYDLIRTRTEDHWEVDAEEVTSNILRIIKNHLHTNSFTSSRTPSPSFPQKEHAESDFGSPDFDRLPGVSIDMSHEMVTSPSPEPCHIHACPIKRKFSKRHNDDEYDDYDDIPPSKRVKSGDDSDILDSLPSPSKRAESNDDRNDGNDDNLGDLDATERDKVLEGLAEITKVDKHSLRHYQPNPANARNIFNWVSGRETSRAEDMSYCLLGLLDIQMPIAYGEGPERAFFRLQVECIRFVDDRSLFLWNGPRSRWNSMFAGVPSAFKDFPKDLGDPRSLSSNHLFKHYQHKKGMDPSFSLTNCGLRIMVALHSVEFVSASTPPSGQHTYTLTLLDPADTEVTLRWQGEIPSPETITERWKVAVVGGFNNNRAFTILLREGESRSPPRYHRWSSAVFTKTPSLKHLTGVLPKTVWIQ
ncbi:hypothetical protein EYR40_003243 [Pleurotus pulmonarius]|nr:hypothetical protein EYR40_003243 [Pleurotus pulmonarius]